MEEKEAHDLMSMLVDTVDRISLEAFEASVGDTLVTGMVASKEHGQMLILGPLDQHKAIGMLLTVIAGAGELIQCFDNIEVEALYALADKTLKIEEPA